VSGDWVVVATGRAKRPHEFSEEKRVKFKQPERKCPFEKLIKEDLLSVCAKDSENPEKNWWVQAVRNKYPAFTSSEKCPQIKEYEVFKSLEGVGRHEVIITRHHERDFAEMTNEEAELVVRAYQERFLAIREDECVKYISIFQNHGQKAGASISHPHSQIIAIPVIPPDIGRSFAGSGRYFEKHKECVHCVVLAAEIKEKKRVIWENKDFLVIAPYASKTAFEMRIFPKSHNAHFEEITSEERFSLADALRAALDKIYKGLKNPDYNFFIHTAPAPAGRRNGAEYDHYHWHLEIIPKTNVWAGFEIGTGIEISTIAPEDAAEFLRGIK